LANHASALKRARQNEKSRARNKAYRTRMRNAIKSVRQAVEQGDAAQAKAALEKAVPIIDKAAAKGTVHKNSASRTVSRLSRKVNDLGA